MSTVTEIEQAIEKLPPAQLGELLAWLDDFKMLAGVADTLFVRLDEEEKTDAKTVSR